MNTHIEIRYMLKYALTALLILAVTFSSQCAPKSKKDEGKIVIVLDAGHGGKDVGAHENGAMEKDINLSVAKKLKEKIGKELKDVKVVMTRSDDRYLTLQERADIANTSGGDLFMSIHVNSVDKSNKRRQSICGSSVYVLGLHKDEDNKRVALRENSVIELENDYAEKYSGFDPQKDESYIIFEMAQKRTLSESIKVAGDAQHELTGRAGRENRGVRQAGFWVLWATSMPAVLVELDFICNPESVKYMTSDKGVETLSESLLEAVRKFVERRRQ